MTHWIEKFPAFDELHPTIDMQWGGETTFSCEVTIGMAHMYDTGYLENRPITTQLECSATTYELAERGFKELYERARLHYENAQIQRAISEVSKGQPKYQDFLRVV